MLSIRRFRSQIRTESRGQALVELAIVMPILVGMVAVLFQLGILFVAYLSLVHEMRDVGRWAAVHPDTYDGASCSDVGSLFAQVCTDAPSVIDPTKLTFSVIQGLDGQTRTCSLPLVNGRCAARPAYAELRMRVQYNASNSLIFLPTDFRLGPWLRVKIPTNLPAYDLSVMVEQH